MLDIVKKRMEWQLRQFILPVVMEITAPHFARAKKPSPRERLLYGHQACRLVAAWPTICGKALGNQYKRLMSHEHKSMH